MAASGEDVSQLKNIVGEELAEAPKKTEKTVQDVNKQLGGLSAMAG